VTAITARDGQVGPTGDPQDGRVSVSAPVFDSARASPICQAIGRAHLVRQHVGKPGGGPTQFKGGRGHSDDAQLQENGRPRKSTFEDPPPFLAALPFGNWHSKALVHCTPDMLQLQLNL
jgi:hypothetical protein